jgi:hypothetical protein
MTTIKHRIRWYVWAGNERIPRQSTMRGQWGYDVECSCGWTTNTGGAVRSYIEQEIWHHKFESSSDDDAYQFGDDCETCGIPASDCGHVRPESVR